MAISALASSRWQTLTAAPHRPMFLIGATQLVLVLLLWFAELLGRAGLLLPAPLPLVIPSTWAHMLLMLYGLFIYFMYGFLFTVFPRWGGGAEVPRGRYIAIGLAAVFGMTLIYAGLLVSNTLLVVGLVLHLGAWVGAVATLLAVFRSARKRTVYEILLMLELSLGAIGIVCFIYGVLGGPAYAFVLAREIGLWGFLLPVLLTVTHRMIPFFTQSALPFANAPRPAWSIGLFVGGSALHGLLELLALPALRLVVDIVLAAVALHHTVVWGLTRSFASRLLAMLHVAFLWFGIGMTLYVIQAVAALYDVAILGRAPLHALGIGFVTGILISMATRVTLGHSGRALAVKAPTWYLFVGLNLVALLRIAAEIAPASAYQTLNLLSAAGWLACLIPWAVRYGTICVTPRVDHRPG